jgi:hypothetical protein
VRLTGEGLLRDVGLVPENPKMRHHKPEPHERDARANPGEKCPLFREIIPQVSHWLFFDRGIHFPASHDWVGTRIARHREARKRAALVHNAFGIR